MAWESRHFNFGVGEESAYLIKEPDKKNNSFYSLFAILFKALKKDKPPSSCEKVVKG